MMLVLLTLIFGGILIVLLLLLANEIRKQKNPRRYSPCAIPIRKSTTARPYRSSVSYQHLPATPPKTITPPSRPSLWGPTGVVLGGRSPQPTEASSATKQQLYKLTGDWLVCDRLVQQVMDKNPSQSEQWAYEKAIWDLERDRL